MCLGIPRVLADRLLEMTHRVVVVAELAKDYPELAVSMGIARLERERGAELACCLPQITLQPESFAQIVVGLRIIRSEFNGFTRRVDGGIEVLALRVSLCQGHLRLDRPWLET